MLCKLRAFSRSQLYCPVCHSEQFLPSPARSDHTSGNQVLLNVRFLESNLLWRWLKCSYVWTLGTCWVHTYYSSSTHQQDVGEVGGGTEWWLKGCQTRPNLKRNCSLQISPREVSTTQPLLIANQLLIKDIYLLYLF